MRPVQPDQQVKFDDTTLFRQRKMYFVVTSDDVRKQSNPSWHLRRNIRLPTHFKPFRWKWANCKE